ncbi:hypothetical protein PIB30_021748 [Stylosanthes scabra]|uniref:Uncharacterized protein n=1 Tax=Stylosanthes scabra TaxID=79078 RepID=A0ABU6T990_9FABA|nr:hypothetical protein [Stylosanthes scabra]
MLVREILRNRFLLHLPYLWTSMRKQDYLRYIEELRRRPELSPLRSRQASVSDSPRSQLIDSLPVITLRAMISLEFGNRHCRENPKYEKFRNRGLPFKDELTILFKDVMGDGKFVLAPSSGILPNGIEDGDGYRPYFEEGHVDLEEGSGDSEKGICVSVGVDTEFQHINLSSSHENSNEFNTLRML